MGTTKFIVLSLVGLGLAGLVGCATGGGARAVAPASAEQKTSLLGAVQKLNGQWETMDEKGQWGPYGSFTAGSGGTAVREVMFPGTEHEMTNMYTMDGDAVLMTHYCAMGNQPHMKCRQATKHSDGSVSLAFEPAGVSDLNAGDEAYMGKMTLTSNADGTLTQEWWQIKQGKVTGEHHMVFKLRRKG